MITGTTAPLNDGLAAAERLLTKLRHDPAAIVLTLCTARYARPG